jgi:hypothetical protein
LLQNCFEVSLISFTLIYPNDFPTFVFENYFNMKLKSLCLGLFCAVLLMSCGHSKMEEAAEKAGKIFGCTSSTISFEMDESGASEQGTVVLHFTDPMLIPADYPAEKFTSICALAFLKNLKMEEYQDYDQVKVVLTRSGSAENKSFPIPQLQKVDQAVVPVSQFLDWRPGVNDESVLKSFDSTFIPDSAVLAFGNALLEQDSINGNTIRHNIIGYRQDHLQENNQPVYVIWAETEKEKRNVPYTFYISEESGKIIYITTGHNE